MALGEPCVKSSYPLTDACKSHSSKVKGVGATLSICPSPKQTRKPFKKRTHTCACSTSVGGSFSLCPVKVARKLYHGAVNHGPIGAHPIPARRPSWPSAGGQFITKSAATLTFQKLAALTETDTRVTEHVCRVTGVAGADIWLIQAFCRLGSRAALEYVRDCHLSSATDVAAKVTEGLRLMEVRENLYQRMAIAVGPERAVECEQEFEQVLEAKVAEMDVTELKQENVQALVEKGMLKAVRETKVKFVLCADSGLGKLHIKKNGTTCWCGRQWPKACRKNAQRWTDIENVCVHLP